MGKKYETKSTRTNKGKDREAQRVRLTILYLLRSKLGLEPNPEKLSEPQPLSLLEVKSYLNYVLTQQSPTERVPSAETLQHTPSE